LDDSCLNEKDYSLCLMGMVKDFATLANLKVIVANEGFDTIKFKYMGGYWVMMKFQTKVTKLKFQENSVMKTWFSQIQLASSDFNTDGRVTWVEIEGIPLKMWSKNTFNRVASKWGVLLDVDDQEDEHFHRKRICINTNVPTNIFESFKLIYRGKVFWVRAKEVPGWILDFVEDGDEKEDSEIGSYEEVPNGEDVKNVEDLEGHFKMSEVPKSGGFILQLIENLVKVGEIVGYDMKGCMKNMEEIIELQGANDDYFVMVRGDWMPNGKKLLIISVDGVDKFIKDSWKDAPIIELNALVKMIKKLKYLKEKIRMWNKLNKEKSHKSKRSFLAEVADCDAVIDKAQKAKIKWAIEGDENSKYYHGVINKKRNQLSICGILVEGTWIDSPSLVKSEFLTHFKNRFEQPNSNRLHVNMHFSNTLNSVQVADLDCQVSKEEIKKAMWDYGIDKSPSPDGFMFGFYRRYWKFIENDVVGAVTCFFHQGLFPKGGNSSFTILIPKTPNANMVKDYRPISLIGSMYKIISKILANRLVVVLGGLVNEIQ
nr:RNA-directed DNA polymerase, eukaryota [Tanacetum cinerariifolium]